MAIRCVQGSVRRASESATQIYDSSRRHKVFIEEQGYAAEIEVDALDPLCDHLLMTQTEPDGTTTDIGTLRFYPPKLKLGRVAILPAYRGGGRGKLLVEALEEHVRERRGKTGDGKAGVALRGEKSVRVLVHSQLHAEGFYARAGYVREGGQFMEDGAPHCLLVKELELVPEEA
ncbi:acyl-CoA N-acyltransferase [Rhodotorula diobovata]|uniref:Acyl-CoA N-acyltransferase n=1 Tax=Rhodotorula diobovata TaxID=5288 RepID=A0A5C5FXQ5_9BASI|nr:acyl-CoA N-acyltransferase [Rhodotorula diobovata]